MLRFRGCKAKNQPFFFSNRAGDFQGALEWMQLLDVIGDDLEVLPA